MLEYRSNELRAKKDAEAASEQQQRLGRQLARAQAEAQDLSTTLAAMQASSRMQCICGPDSCAQACQFAHRRQYAISAATLPQVLRCLRLRHLDTGTCFYLLAACRCSSQATSAQLGHDLQEEQKVLKQNLRSAMLGAQQGAERPMRDSGTQTTAPDRPSESQPGPSVTATAGPSAPTPPVQKAGPISLKAATLSCDAPASVVSAAMALPGGCAAVHTGST